MHRIRRLNLTSKLLALAAACIVNSAPMASAQAAPAPLPAFEVATIKPFNINDNGTSGFVSYPGGRVNVGYASLRVLVFYAFDVQGYQIVGGPDWIDKERYNIVGRAPASSDSATARKASFQTTPNDEQRKMLQSLLAERFGFKFHRETKEGPVYVLTKGNNKLQMQDAKDKDGYMRGAIIMKQGGIVDGEADAQNIPMSYFASVLSRHLGRPVLDQTGLTGSYDFHLNPDDPTNTDMEAAVFDVVKRLGLKITPGKGPIETIVIDNATKPTEN